jgi:hypothetical protein
VKQAVGEIKKVARKNPALAARPHHRGRPGRREDA